VIKQIGEHKKDSAFVEGITWLSLARKAVNNSHLEYKPTTVATGLRVYSPCIELAFHFNKTFN